MLSQYPAENDDPRPLSLEKGEEKESKVGGLIKNGYRIWEKGEVLDPTLP
jgi:hypothetical protein